MATQTQYRVTNQYTTQLVGHVMASDRHAAIVAVHEATDIALASLVAVPVYEDAPRIRLEGRIGGWQD